MRNKGFTLIELLAVIVVLGIIMVIAVTAVNNYINTSKIDAFLLNEKMIVKATQKYLAAGVVNYPSNIGDTVEVRLSDLQSNGFIERIKSPSNQSIECEGYLIVTKIETGKYDYTPHLDCQNGIGSVSEDGLLVHYTFDDFQESTTNLVSNNSFESGNTNGWVIGNANSGISEIDNNNSVFGTKSLKITISNGGDQFQYFSYNYGTSIAGRTFTVSAWIKTSNITGQGVSILTYWKDSTGTWISANITRSSYLTGNSGWTRLTATGVAPANAYEATVIIAPTYPANGQGTYWIDGAQIEEKGYPTPFVDGIRTSIVKDYSGNGNNISLAPTSTPKWNESRKTGSGEYLFNKTTTLMNRTGYTAPPANNFTVSSWIKINSHAADSNVGNMIVSSYQSSNGWFLSLIGPNSRLQLRNHNGTITTYSVVYQTPLSLNQWYHVAASDDGTLVKLYINGIKVISASSVSSTQNQDLRIGSFSDTNYILDGAIDEVRIYNRALSENEILQLYNATK